MTLTPVQLASACHDLAAHTYLQESDRYSLRRAVEEFAAARDNLERISAHLADMAQAARETLETGCATRGHEFGAERYSLVTTFAACVRYRDAIRDMEARISEANSKINSHRAALRSVRL